MANLKLIIRKNQTKENGECNIYVQLTHKGKADWIATNIYVKPEYFAACRVQSGRGGDKNASYKNIALQEKLSEFERRLLSLPDLYTLDIKKIKQYLLSETESIFITDFVKFTEKRLCELEAIGRKGTVSPLRNTLVMVRSFHSKSLSFDDVTTKWLEKFVAYYKAKGHKTNSIAVYLRYIRCMFNDAIDEYNVNPAKPVINNYPFRRFKIETERTRNRNLDIEVVKKIRDISLSGLQEKARDIFMLQICLMGINIKDLFYLKHESIVGDRLEYKRAKTGRFYNIKIEPEAQRLINKYKGEKYLLSFADHCNEVRTMKKAAHTRQSLEQYADSRALNKMVNKHMKEIAMLLEINVSITSYYARHSFASILRSLDVSRDDISLCLGHTDPTAKLVTGVYINEDFERADIANRKFLDALS